MADPIWDEGDMRDLCSRVIEMAIRDASLGPYRKTRIPRPRDDALNAMDFLFNERRAGLDAYCFWLDIDVEQMRLRILDMMEEGSTYNPVSARCFRGNYEAWYRGARAPADLYEEKSDEEEEEFQW